MIVSRIIRDNDAQVLAHRFFKMAHDERLRVLRDHTEQADSGKLDIPTMRKLSEAWRETSRHFVQYRQTILEDFWASRTCAISIRFAGRSQHGGRVS